MNQVFSFPDDPGYNGLYKYEEFWPDRLKKREKRNFCNIS